MKNDEWFKAYHGMPADAKLAVVARRSGLKRGEILALWIALLDHASRNTPRGSVEHIDAEQLAVILEFDDKAIDTALAALRDKNMISKDNMLTDWEKHQYLASSAQRVRNWRARRNIITASAKPDLPSPHKPPATPERNRETCDEDSPEAIARRRQRLRDEVIAGHKAKGRSVVEDRPL